MTSGTVKMEKTGSEATSSAEWPVRDGFAVSSFNNKLWIIGGNINDYERFASDIWSSSDGTTWTQVIDQALWPVRASHQAVVHDNKIWIIGGSADQWDSEYNDMWYSKDGYSWIKADNAGWEARRGHSATVHNNKLFVIGGRVGSSWTLSNDVWSGTIGLEKPTYTLCWDKIPGNCANSITTQNTSYTLPQALTAGNWYFKVTVSGLPASAYDIRNSQPHVVAAATTNRSNNSPLSFIREFAQTLAGDDNTDEDKSITTIDLGENREFTAGSKVSITLEKDKIYSFTLTNDEGDSRDLPYYAWRDYIYKYWYTSSNI